jgi:putative ABC transport system substrate-binding protein
MRRRDFLLAGLLVPSMAARAQHSGTRRRIAFFHPAIPVTLMTETGGGSAWRAFFSELRRLGYVEGQNLTVERRYPPGP